MNSFWFRNNKKWILTLGSFFALLVVGGGFLAALFLSRSSQDVRNRASTGEGIAEVTTRPTYVGDPVVGEAYSIDVLINSNGMNLDAVQLSALIDGAPVIDVKFVATDSVTSQIGYREPYYYGEGAAAQPTQGMASPQPVEWSAGGGQYASGSGSVEADPGIWRAPEDSQVFNLSYNNIVDNKVVMAFTLRNVERPFSSTIPVKLGTLIFTPAQVGEIKISFDRTVSKATVYKQGTDTLATPEQNLLLSVKSTVQASPSPTMIATPIFKKCNESCIAYTNETCEKGLECYSQPIPACPEMNDGSTEPCPFAGASAPVCRNPGNLTDPTCGAAPTPVPTPVATPTPGIEPIFCDSAPENCPSGFVCSSKLGTQQNQGPTGERPYCIPITPPSPSIKPTPTPTAKPTPIACQLDKNGSPVCPTYPQVSCPNGTVKIDNGKDACGCSGNYGCLAVMPTNPSPTPTPAPCQFEYGNWSECRSGVQYRTVATSGSGSCVSSSVSTVRSCETGCKLDSDCGDGQTCVTTYVSGGWQTVSSDRPNDYYVPQELTGVCLLQKTTADINGDGRVNLVDISMLVRLLFSNDLTADLNGDGAVDVVDYSLLIRDLSVAVSTPIPQPYPGLPIGVSPSPSSTPSPYQPQEWQAPYWIPQIDWEVFYEAQQNTYQYQQYQPYQPSQYQGGSYQPSN